MEIGVETPNARQFDLAVVRLTEHQQTLMERLNGLRAAYAGREPLPEVGQRASSFLSCSEVGTDKFIFAVARHAKFCARGEIAAEKWKELRKKERDFFKCLKQAFPDETIQKLIKAIEVEAADFISLLAWETGISELGEVDRIKKVNDYCEKVRASFYVVLVEIAGFECGLEKEQAKKAKKEKKKGSRMDLKGTRTKAMESQLDDFALWVAEQKKIPSMPGRRESTIGALAKAYWREKDLNKGADGKGMMERARTAAGENKGYESARLLARAYHRMG